MAGQMVLESVVLSQPGPYLQKQNPVSLRLGASRAAQYDVP